MPAADTAGGQDVRDAAELVDHRGGAAFATGVVFVDHDDDHAKHGQLREHDDQLHYDHAAELQRPDDIVNDDDDSFRLDFVFVRYDVRFGAPKNQLVSVTEVGDGRVPHSARSDP